MEALRNGDINRWLNGPEARAHAARYGRRVDRIDRVIGWTKRIPVFGRVIHTFWFLMFDEGPYQTLKPRWGGLTFSFMGDTDQVSLWHTWQEIIGSDYAGVWAPRRNPSSKAEADHLRARHVGENWTRKCGKWCEEES